MTDGKRNELSLIFSAGTPLIALPGWKNPRLIFEAGSLRQRWRDSHFFDAYSVRGQLRKFFLRVVSVVLPGRRLQTGTPVSAVDEFADELTFLRKAVLIGRDDPRQKWTVAFLDENGNPVAFVKYGSRTAARQAVLNEIKALSGLPSGAGPILLKSGDIGLGTAFMMTPVDGVSVGRAPLSEQARDYVFRWIARLSVGRVVSAAQHPAVGRMRKNLAGTGIPMSAFNGWINKLREQMLPVGWQHGDATLWNLRVLPNGDVRAIDWEDAVEEGCPLFDLVYYVIQMQFFLCRADARQAFVRSVDWLRWQGVVGGDCAGPVVRLAACDAWLRWKKCGWQDDHPVQLFRKKIWNLPLDVEGKR